MLAYSTRSVGSSSSRAGSYSDMRQPRVWACERLFAGNTPKKHKCQRYVTVDQNTIRHRRIGFRCVQFSVSGPLAVFEKPSLWKREN